MLKNFTSLSTADKPNLEDSPHTRYVSTTCGRFDVRPLTASVSGRHSNYGHIFSNAEPILETILNPFLLFFVFNVSEDMFE